MKNNLKSLREMAGFRTQKALADAIGLTSVYINQWENGKSYIQHKHIGKLCETLKCKEETLGLTGKYYETTKKESEMLILRTNLAAVMQERNINQQQLADKLGVSKQYISSIIKADNVMTLGTISKLAKVLEIEIDSLRNMPILKKDKLAKVKSYFRDEEDIDFDEAYKEAKKLLPSSTARRKVLLMEDCPVQMKMAGRMIKSQIRSLEIDNILIQHADKVRVGCGIIREEEEDIKLVIMDLVLSDTKDSLDYLIDNAPEGDYILIVASAIDDEERINQSKNNPKVFGFIKKGSQVVTEIYENTAMLNSAFTKAFKN